MCWSDRGTVRRSQWPRARGAARRRGRETAGLCLFAGSLLGLFELWLLRTAVSRRRLWTERRLARQREEARSSFLLLASHELRTPIAVLRGYVDIMSSGTLGPVSLEATEALLTMDGKLKEMEHLVHEMAETARIDGAPSPREHRSIEARELVAEAVERMLPLAGPAHRVSVAAPAAPVRFSGDRARMGTVLTNLIGNAIKYSPDGGRIGITVARDRRTVTISVSDEGIGIPADKMGMLFRPFSRIANGAAEGIDGIGVGLFLSREIARSHRGDLNATARPGPGATFVLTLPAE